MIAAGFGMRREVEAEELVALCERAVRESGLGRAEITCFAALQDRVGLPAFRAMTLHFRVASRGIVKADITRVKARLATHSQRIEELYGVGSVAEAVALVAAGEEARLILPRIASGAATCAIAGSET